VLMHANDGCVDHLHRNVMSPASALMILAPTPAGRQRTKRL